MISPTGPRRPFPARRLFLTAWLIYATHWAPFLIREQFPAVTLATKGTLNVEPFLGYSNDIFRGPRGGAFINNNPGASILGALPLLLTRPALDALARWNDTSPATLERAAHPERYEAAAAVKGRREWYFLAVAFLTAACVMAPISALSLTLFGRALWSAGVSASSATAAALLFGFATPVFLRTGYLNHNLLVCHTGLFAALLLYDRARRPLAISHTIAAGALAGYGVLCDFSGGIGIAVLGLYVLSRAGDASTGGIGRRVQFGGWFTLGALPMLLALAAYQQWAFGHSALPSQQFMPAIEETSRGYRGIDWPALDIAWMNFFDPRFGLFAVCPLLALGLIAPLLRQRLRIIADREMWFILLQFLGLTLFCAANQYSRLQWQTGLRYLVPVVPGLLVLSLPVLEQMPAALRVSLVAIDGFLSWLSAATQVPLAHMVSRPGDFQLAWVRRVSEYDAISRPVLVSLLIVAALLVMIWTIWRSELSAARRLATSAIA